MYNGRKRDNLCINTIRTLSMDAVQNARSGHPGTPMALAPVAFVLWDRFMNYNPVNPDWPNRDRFVLSAGHASMLLYSVLHIFGYNISIDDIRKFRQLHSRCAGHPEYGLAPGIETTTGPLGQGVATSVGMAIAEKWMAHYFNRQGFKIIDYGIFAIAGDGCMMEGVSGEAASLAGHLGLDNLIWIYDNNRITIEGNTSLAFNEDVAARFMAYNWNVQRVGDANDIDMLERAVTIARKEDERPSLIIVDSHIAYGSPNKQDTSGAHGEPLGEDEVRATKMIYGWDPKKAFYVPPEVQKFAARSIQKGRKRESDWNQMFEEYRQQYPDAARDFTLIQNRELPENWQNSIPSFHPSLSGISGRVANGMVLNALAEHIPWFFGGSADLAPSTKTLITSAESFSRVNYGGRNIHFGIREHAMGAILNGMALSKLRPYGATFLVFSDYLRPPLRLSALMEQPVIYIFTHDSIAVGEDGPTHQPVEHLASLRAIPQLEVIRPADANELAILWEYILSLKDKPVALILSRQKLPTLSREKFGSREEVLRGGYIIADTDRKPEVILLSAGSEVHLCLDAHEQLLREGIASRVVSLPCWGLFELQDTDYWQSVIPDDVCARVAVEAGSTFGWRQFIANSECGSLLGIKAFGESAPLKDVLLAFGLTTESVVTAAKKTIARVQEMRNKKRTCY